MSQPKRTVKELSDFLRSSVSYLDWRIIVNCGEDSRPYLQVAFNAPDSDLGTYDRPIPQFGRKWYLSPYMTNTELVRTTHKAVRAAVEHECDENFKYHGQAIFSPHTDVTKLLTIRMMDKPDDVRK